MEGMQECHRRRGSEGMGRRTLVVFVPFRPKIENDVQGAGGREAEKKRNRLLLFVVA